MNRSPAQRLIAILMAALFSLGGEGAGLLRHACPHHDLGFAPVAVAQAPADAGDHAHHAEAPPSAEAVNSLQDDGGHSRHEGGACTCPGVCEAGVGKTLPSVPGAAVRIAVSRHSDHRPSLHDAAPRGVTPYLLPYANAPPRAG